MQFNSRWNFYGRVCSRTLDLNNPYCGIDDENRIAWQGVPSIDNKCVILIAKPELKDSGTWTCQLIQDDNEVAMKSFKITVYSKAVVSFESRPHEQVMVNKGYVIECSGIGGVPPPNLTVLVKPTNGDYEKILEPVETSSDGMLGGTITSIFNYVPAKDHRFMTIQCVATQEDIFVTSSSPVNFEVVFPPLPPETPVQSFYITEGQIATVTIDFYANPAPRDDQVIWHIVGQATNRSQMIVSGTSKSRFEAHSIEVEDTLIKARLSIYEASLEDILNYCYLEVQTMYGRFEYRFALHPAPITEPSQSVEEDLDDGLSVGAIIGIVIGCILVMTAIFIGVVYCKKTGALCFQQQKTATSKDRENYMSVQQKDNETQNVNLSQIQMRSTSSIKNRDSYIFATNGVQQRPSTEETN